MANRQKQKGDRAERGIVKKLVGIGVDAQRVPLSGAAGGYFGGDLTIKDLPGLGNLLGEVKSRAGGGGFKLLEKWMGSNDLLFLKRDHQEPLVVMPWEVFERFLGVVVGAENKDTERRQAGPVSGPLEPEEIDAELELAEQIGTSLNQYFGFERT